MSGDGEQKFGIRKVSLLALGHMIADSYPGMINPVIPLLMTKLNFGVFYAGFISSVIGVSSSLLQPMAGYLSDRIRNRFLILVGPVIAAIGFSFIDIARNYYFLLFLVFFGGIGVALYHPQAASIVRQKSTGKRATAMSVFVAGGTLGYSFGPLMITTLVALGGLKYTYFAVIPGFLVSILLFKNVERLPERKANKEKLSFLEAFKLNPSVIVILCLIVIVRAFVVLGFHTFVPILIAERGEAFELGGFTIFFYQLLGAFGGFAGGSITDRYKISEVVILSSFILVIPLLLFYLQLTGIVSLIVYAFVGFVLFSSIPVVISLAQSKMPTHVGTISSMVMGFSWGIAGLLVSVLGKLAEIYGIEKMLTMLAFFPVLGIILSVFLIVLKGKDKQQVVD